jgi:hypothetical protein
VGIPVGRDVGTVVQPGRHTKASAKRREAEGVSLKRRPVRMSFVSERARRRRSVTRSLKHACTVDLVSGKVVVGEQRERVRANVARRLPHHLQVVLGDPVLAPLHGRARTTPAARVGPGDCPAREGTKYDASHEGFQSVHCCSKKHKQAHINNNARTNAPSHVNVEQSEPDPFQT